MAPPTKAEREAALAALAEMYGIGTTGTLDRNALRQLLEGLSIDVPINSTDVTDAAQAYLDAQNAAAQMSPWGPSSLEDIAKQPAVQQARAELVRRANDLWGTQAGGNVAESISNYVTSQVQREQETTSVEQRTSRAYLDIPTPEEFLNKFETGLATHVQAQVKAGTLSRNAGLWLLDNPEVLYNDYMADLGARAAKGEQIFKPVGVGGTPEFLGTRPGAVETRQTESETKALEEAQSQAQESATSVQAAGAGGGGGTSQRQTTTTTEQQTATTEKQKELSQLSQTEEIYARPNLNYAYAISPLEWLQKRTDLEMLYQGERGTKRREAATATAPPIVLPRVVR